MINKLNENTILKFKNLSPEEKEKKGILGRLYGKVADFTNGTRNGRKYSEQLWENLLNSDLIKERFANGGIFGQLCHPEYEEVDMEKIACVMPEPPVKDKDGQLVAYVDILDTPCGRIAYQLAKYGYKLGISSRGTGDLITGPDGEEEVDPDTYQLNAFDLVEIPAVESARLSFVESLDKKRYNKTLRQSLTESLNKATPEDRKLMEESLNDLGIDLNESASQELNKYYQEWKDKNPGVDFESLLSEYEKESGKLLSDIMYSENDYNNFVTWAEEEKGTHIKGLDESFDPRGYSKVIKAIGDGIENDDNLDDLRDYLQNIIGYCRSIADDYGILVENVNNDKVVSDTDKDEEVVDNKSDMELVAEFQESLLKIKKLEEDNLSLQEQLSVGNAKEIKLNEDLSRYKESTIRLSDAVKELKPVKEEVSKLEESLKEKDKIISTNKSRINSLVESRKKAQSEIDSLKESNEELNKKNSSLNEELDNSIKKYEVMSKQLDSSKNLIEKYKRSYKSLKENYLEIKATSYGLRKEEVLKKLDESYRIKDIDAVCEELSQFKTNISKLPFRLTENTKFSVKPSENEYIKGNRNNFDDDYVTSSLLHLADIK